jgi:hypothetical protein
VWHHIPHPGRRRPRLRCHTAGGGVGYSPLFRFCTTRMRAFFDMAYTRALAALLSGLEPSNRRRHRGVSVRFSGKRTTARVSWCVANRCWVGHGRGCSRRAPAWGPAAAGPPPCLGPRAGATSRGASARGRSGGGAGPLVGRAVFWSVEVLHASAYPGGAGPLRAAATCHAGEVLHAHEYMVGGGAPSGAAVFLVVEVLHATM